MNIMNMMNTIKNKVMSKLCNVIIPCHILLNFFSPQALAQKGEDLLNLTFKPFEHAEKKYLGLKLQLEPGWHIYWKNPGDSGIPTTIELQSKNHQLQLSALEWPMPERFIESEDLWTIGYRHSNFFIYEIQTPLAANDEITISLEYLVCKELCIPGKKTYTIAYEQHAWNIPSEWQSSESDEQWLQYLASLPSNTTSDAQKKDAEFSIKWQLYRTQNKDEFTLFYYIIANPNVSARPSINSSYNLLTPFPLLPFNFKHEKLYKNSQHELLGVTRIEWDGLYQNPVQKIPNTPSFTTPYDLQFLLWNPYQLRAQIVHFKAQNWQVISEENLKSLTSSWQLIPLSSVASTPENETANFQNAPSTNPAINDHSSVSLEILWMLVFAFMGGLILNFMPCVLPIISLKMYGLIEHAKKSKSEIFRHHLSYTMGVLTCFFILAVSTLVLKKSGEQIGWGFQLQSPLFLWSIILILFMMALNLFGLFEWHTPGSRWIHRLQARNPYLDDFLTGLLAVIVATPCSAPFLGTALTFAFAAPTTYLFIIFIFMGLGLASPFIIIAWNPQLIHWLPKPGLWMNTFKYFLGLTLLLTIIWLIDILLQIIATPENSFVILTLGTLTMIFFYFFLKHLKHHQPAFERLLLLFVFFGVVKSFQAFTSSDHAASNAETTSSATPSSSGWQSWNEAQIQTWLTQGDSFFLDFTAKWCITCQVNKKLIFERSAFLQWATKNKVKLMRIDWTKRSPEIARWLEANGAISVPAYYLGHQGKLLFLGEITSQSSIEERLNELKK